MRNLASIFRESMNNLHQTILQGSRFLTFTIRIVSSAAVN